MDGLAPQRRHFFRVFERSLIVGTAQTRRDLLEILPRPGRAEARPHSLRESVAGGFSPYPDRFPGNSRASRF
jgi:hypothetical protein